MNLRAKFNSNKSYCIVFGKWCERSRPIGHMCLDYDIVKCAGPAKYFGLSA